MTAVVSRIRMGTQASRVRGDACRGSSPFNTMATTEAANVYLPLPEGQQSN